MSNINTLSSTGINISNSNYIRQFEATNECFKKHAQQLISVDKVDTTPLLKNAFYYTYFNTIKEINKCNMYQDMNIVAEENISNINKYAINPIKNIINLCISDIEQSDDKLLIINQTLEKIENELNKKLNENYLWGGNNSNKPPIISGFSLVNNSNYNNDLDYFKNNFSNTEENNNSQPISNQTKIAVNNIHASDQTIVNLIGALNKYKYYVVNKENDKELHSIKEDCITQLKQCNQELNQKIYYNDYNLEQIKEANKRHDDMIDNLKAFSERLLPAPNFADLIEKISQNNINIGLINTVIKATNNIIKMVISNN